MASLASLGRLPKLLLVPPKLSEAAGVTSRRLPLPLPLPWHAPLAPLTEVSTVRDPPLQPLTLSLSLSDDARLPNGEVFLPLLVAERALCGDIGLLPLLLGRPN